ncbi:ClpXP protease specificity-enhancing factor [Plasticicumulans acidivorans]|uniref:Stringent starvation protein B n=1 Tax=Plasticicumulans acidivorans TaxID=886464 RepID=A0A317MV62_9GAMM|nr:ClpXP protease specificity-enhancing factor [Plasticicumulans acidivorans]PWV61817.1 stringent starvation protein B [Plasticicumulans acidivorans]
MTSNRPYLIRALYEWILDNGMTPHILVNAGMRGVDVPSQHVHEGRIVLNISPSAVQGLVLGNDAIDFSARFSGVAQQVHVPISAVLAIYSRENGQGTAFPDEEDQDEPPPQPPRPDAGKRPTLKVVK